MMGFVTLSSTFVANVVLFLVMMGHGEVMLAILPLVGSTLCGMGVTHFVMMPEKAKKDAADAD
jgi:hypothetical protein